MSNNIYQQNRKTYDSIEKKYLRLFRESPFAVAYSDPGFTHVKLEFISDTLTRVYEFKIGDTRLQDTLLHYNLDTNAVMGLLSEMKRVRCIWLDNFDYYVNGKEHRVTYVSIKPVTIRYPLSQPKFIILAYFPTPQVFDKNGILLDSRRTKRQRKLGGHTFRKITDRICFTIAEKYR